MNRIQISEIIQDLDKKMVFMIGPRQVGKTHLAQQVMKHFKDPLYLNYDRIEDRQIIVQENWLESVDLLVLDELHKMPQWKNYLKGIYDTRPSTMRILVTGSARLGIYQHAGDSLAGRYFCHHLLPFSLAELDQLDQETDLDFWLNRSGFPEPYLSPADIDAERWRMQYIDSIVNIDVLSFDNIHNLAAMRTVLALLRTKVGSPISYQSLAQDSGISAPTTKKYVEILEALYIIFRVTPFAKNIGRSLLKEPKVYFFDSKLVKGHEGAIIENGVAMSLLKHVYAKRDYDAQPYSLHYLRTKEKREVDFALVCDDQIMQAIEVKTTDKTISPTLKWYCEKYQLPGVQVVKHLKREYQMGPIAVRSAINFLKALQL